MAFMIQDADQLVAYLKDFTGSSNDAEIKQAIFQAELMLRNVELPGLRSDPYAVENIGIVGENSLLDIPGDMNKPILFFQTGSASGETTSGTGPWVVYDRVGDREIITMGLVAQFYLNPVNVPAVIRGKFSEVSNKYQFVPYVGAGTPINMYYYKAWPLLFAPAQDLISNTGVVGDIGGSGPWTGSITGMTSTLGLEPADVITALSGTGSLGGGQVVVETVAANSITFTATGGTAPTPGTITDINLSTYISTNAVLETFPEGYIYGALHEYYIKRHSAEDAQIYKSKFDLAMATVEDQNNLGKWSGGSTRLTSIFQPRRSITYDLK